MAYPDRVKAILDDTIADIAQDKKKWVLNPGADFTRNRKLSFIQMLHMLVAMGSNAIQSEMCRYIGYKADTPTTSAFCQARAKLVPEATREVLTRFTSKFESGSLFGMCPVACDGSAITLPSDIVEASTRVSTSDPEKRDYNALHATALFDLVAKRYMDCVIEPQSHYNEHSAFCVMADRWSYKATPLFILDRGIAGYNVYAHAAKADGFFLIRLTDKKAAGILGHGLGDDSLDESVHLILSRTKSKKLHACPEREDDYRAVNPNVDFDFITQDNPEYEIDLRVARFAISDDTFENVVTNLPKSKFSLQDLRELYWMRWGIETSFRDLKYTIGACALHSSRLSFASQEVFARMVLFNFGSIIASRVAQGMNQERKQGEKYEHVINLAFALKSCCDYLKACAQKLERPPNIEEMIRRKTSPVRPDRRCTRRPRVHMPPAFAYRFS